MIKEILERDFKKESYKSHNIIIKITKGMKEDCKKCEDQDFKGDYSDIALNYEK